LDAVVLKEEDGIQWDSTRKMGVSGFERGRWESVVLKQKDGSQWF
jgi:hypothetical protein